VCIHIEKKRYTERVRIINKKQNNLMCIREEHKGMLVFSYL